METGGKHVRAVPFLKCRFLWLAACSLRSELWKRIDLPMYYEPGNPCAMPISRN